MTFGEKLKEARKKSGLSQEQLAQKLCLSRQAVTKWESDRGLPDVINLKALSSLLDVSVDYLLDDGNSEKMNVIKEIIDWSKYPKEKWNNLKEDFVVMDKYPDAVSITQLSRKKKRNRTEKIADNLLFLIPLTPDNMSQVYDKINDPSIYYLVELHDKLILANVTEEYIISYRLPQQKVNKKIEIGSNIFTITKRKIQSKTL